MLHSGSGRNLERHEIDIVIRPPIADSKIISQESPCTVLVAQASVCVLFAFANFEEHRLKPVPPPTTFRRCDPRHT